MTMFLLKMIFQNSVSTFKKYLSLSILPPRFQLHLVENWPSEVGGENFLLMAHADR